MNWRAHLPATLLDIIDHPVVKTVARGAMALALVVSGWIGAQMLAMDNRMDGFDTAIATVQQTQSVRARDSEEFQRDVLAFQVATARDVDGLQSDLAAIKGDVREVRAIVSLFKDRILSGQVRVSPYPLPVPMELRSEIP